MKRNTKNIGFLRLDHDFLRSERYAACSVYEKCLYIAIADRFNGRNNGAIPYSVTEAARWIPCSRRTAWKAFQGLQERGLIIARAKGSFDYKTGANKGKATEWYLPDLGGQIIDLSERKETA